MLKLYFILSLEKYKIQIQYKINKVKLDDFNLAKNNNDLTDITDESI